MGYNLKHAHSNVAAERSEKKGAQRTPKHRREFLRCEVGPFVVSFSPREVFGIVGRDPSVVVHKRSKGLRLGEARDIGLVVYELPGDEESGVV